MKAITVKHLGWTNTKPYRLKAYDQDGNTITLSANGGVSPRDAAQALCEKMGWTGRLVGGSLSAVEDVFVFDEPEVHRG